jgi:sn-glycerol 3-phosphate transport system substrate-binding protein
MRKWTACLIGLLITAMLVPGGARAQTGITLTYDFPIGVSGPLYDLMTGIVNDFNRTHPGITVQPVFAGNYVQAMAKAMTGVMGGSPPDVAVLDSPELYSLLDQNAIIPLDDFIAKQPRGWLDDFYATLLTNARSNGHMYSIPYQRSTVIFFYNQDMFKKAGLDPSTPPKNWAELVADAQKLTVRDASGNVTQWGVEAPIVDTSPWVIQGFFIEQKAKYFDASNGKWVKFNSPETVSALQFYLDLQNKYKVAPTGPSSGTFWGQVPQDFIQQKAAMIYTTTGNMTFIRQNAQFNWNAAFMPAGKQYGSPTGGGSMYIFKTTPEREQAAWTFVTWMTDPAQAARWSIGTGYVPIRKTELSTPAFAAYMQQLPQALTATLQLRVAGEQMSIHDVDRVGTILLTAVQEAQSGKRTAQAALDEAQQAATQDLAKY